MRLYLYSFFSVFLSIVGINIFFDPANLLSNKILISRYYANELLDGNSVSLPKSIDTRALHSSLISLNRKKVDIAVLGTSRVHFINSNTLKNHRILNNGIGGSNILEIIGLYQAYLNKGEPYPSTMIIGLDEWFFYSRRTRALSQWIIYENEIKQFLATENVRFSPGFADWFETSSEEGSFWLRLKTIFSLQYFLNSIHTTDSIYLFPDGHLQFPSSMLNRSKESAYEAFHKTIENFDSYTLSGFAGPGPDEWKLFMALIQSMRSKNITPVLFLSPHQHEVYQYMKKRKEGHAIDNLEVEIRKYANQRNIRIVGSYNPYFVPCGQDEFMDEHHMREVCYSRLFEAGLDK
ncbi:hypothetical protein [Leptospira yasudae]|uniref:DUF1574 domain-containing protein n=1 Tax=Leptospira yasudae TaxID=2202201 RepID=A0ABX9M018_9LEPT|nr:hypothetical protein [Leptospira yasudae]RHX78287.1 hypothetical protein DLM77_17800 [Leptospira yasudae]